MKDKTCWLLCGDLHDDAGAWETMPELADAAGLIISGDLTFNGGRREAERLLAPLAGKVPVIFAQMGNMDRPGVTELLEEKGWNLHGRAAQIAPGLVIMGLGGSSPTPFGTPGEFSEELLAAWLEEAHSSALELLNAARAGGMARPLLVLVSHCPPLGTVCDRLGNGASAGSRAVRSFIEARQPDFCFCGHIHEARGEDRIGATRVINPGDPRSGGYLLLEPAQGPDGPLLEVSFKP